MEKNQLFRKCIKVFKSQVFSAQNLPNHKDDKNGRRQTTAISKLKKVKLKKKICIRKFRFIVKNKSSLSISVSIFFTISKILKTKVDACACIHIFCTFPLASSEIYEIRKKSSLVDFTVQKAVNWTRFLVIYLLKIQFVKISTELPVNFTKLFSACATYKFAKESLLN